MRIYRAAAVAITFACICGFAQDTLPKPRVSTEPLTAEQVAMYRAALKHYLNKVQITVNLASTTEPFDFDNDSCAKGMGLDKPDSSVRVVHKLESSEMDDARILLVEKEQQLTKITQSDPEYLIRGMAEGKQISNEELKGSLNQGFETGMLSFSEIVFDKTHHRAAVSYRYFCGRLCGHGETLLFQKAGDKWKIKRLCGGWVS